MRGKKLVMVIRWLMVLLLIWFCWYSFQLYRKRKETETMIGEGTVLMPVSVNDSFDMIRVEDKLYTRKSWVKAYLCIGVDSVGGMNKKVSTAAGQADAIMVVAHNIADNTIKILMIPRDTMTPITLTDLQGNVLGKDTHHITLAYTYGDGQELSCERTREAVSELLFGLWIDGYMALNIDMISVLNDMVGGVAVEIETDGMEQADPEFQLGSTVILQGRQAEKFVCYRDINQDHSGITRMIQQKQYMESFFNTLQIKAVEEDQLVMDIIQAIQNNMITDLRKDQYMKVLLAIVNNRHPLTPKDILCIPGQDVTTIFFDEFHHDPIGSRQMVLELFYREEKDQRRGDS